MTAGRLRVIMEADGGARGNPGPAGYGAVVREAGTGQVLAERSAALGVATNNVAEYSGLIAGLQAAADLGAAEVEVRMDSKLVVEQMSGRWQIKNPGLRPLAAQAAALVRRFDTVTFDWVPRERNKHADGLANAAMDAAARRPGASGRPGASSGLGASGGSAVSGGPGASSGLGASGGFAVSGGPGAANGPGGPGVSGDPGVPGVAGPATAVATAAPRPVWELPDEPAVRQPTRLILVRHGETALTAQRRYSGRGDVALSARGLVQAQATALRVAQLTGSSGAAVAAVATSPLSRCTRTARLIAAELGSPPVLTEPDLIECDFGAWEGRTFAEVRATWPAELNAWLGSTAVAPPGGESLQAVDARVRRAVAALREAYPASVVVLVSHVSPLKVLLRDALAASDAFLHRLFLDPAGVSIVDSWPDGGVCVRTVNDTAHLVPDRPS